MVVVTLKVVRERLGWTEARWAVDPFPSAFGPGNALILKVESEHVTEVFSGFGQRGVAAERVATVVAREVRADLAAPGAPAVSEHLADQLLDPLHWLAAGRFPRLS